MASHQYTHKEACLYWLDALLRAQPLCSSQGIQADCGFDSSVDLELVMFLWLSEIWDACD